MGADHSKTPTELEQYLTLLRQRDGAGLPFVIVGGHAVNFWAKLYLDREPKLRASLPFTSKDLDVIGSESEARQAAQATGWYVSPPPVGGGPVQAVLSSEAGGTGLAVEFLSEIKGVSRETIVENAHEGIVRVPGTGEMVTVRVLDPVLSGNANELNLLRFWMLGEALGSWFSKECSSGPPENGIVFR
jgi:hypothetical protein